MAKTNLTEEKKAKIIEALNNDIEPSPELMEKLFPSLAEKFDVAKLDRARVVRLEYAGKRSEAAILNLASPTDAGSPLQVERCFSGGTLTCESQLDLFQKAKETGDCEWQNLIVQGDNLQFLKTCYQNADPLIKDKVKGKVKLIYIDPPFATRGDFKGAEDERSYSDKVATAEFTEGLRERLLYLREILADDGCIYLHLDLKMCHYIKVVMDEVFERHNFRNELIWQKIRVVKAQSLGFGNVHDSLLLYSKTPNIIFNAQERAQDDNYDKKFDKVEKETSRRYQLVSLIQKGNGPPRIFGDRAIEPPAGMHWIWSQERINKALQDGLIEFTSTGNPRKKQYLDDSGGKFADDLWTDIFPVNSQAKESVGYPTQKPEALLERIILASSNPGDLVMDVFAGSGTTAAVAEKLGRRWIVCDFGKHAIYTMQKRMLRIAESKALGKDVKKNKKYGQPPKPFCVVSTGAYDFSRIMKLREHKDAYIDFVLGLFQLSRAEQDLTAKYKLTNIYAEKDGDPVEVYPVWEDEYLKNIRIDKHYLEGIIQQSRRRLKNEYYIITPETCTLVGDRTIPNGSGGKVDFKLLKFPYKILEDVSRNFQIHEQPSSPENVNELINSTGFYFNDQVEIGVNRTKDGLKITRFETKILNREGERFRALEGLAMLLVDVDYDGELFEVDRTFFLKDIDENGEVKMGVPKGDVAVIAIDKHGNESRPLILKG